MDYSSQAEGALCMRIATIEPLFRAKRACIVRLEKYSIDEAAEERDALADQQKVYTTIRCLPRESEKALHAVRARLSAATTVLWGYVLVQKRSRKSY